MESSVVESNVVAFPEPDKPQINLADLRAQLESMTISDQTSYDRMVDLTVRLASSRKRVEEFYAPRKKKARDAWQQWVDDEKLFLDPIKELESSAKDKVQKWEAEQKRIQKELDEQAEHEALRISQEIALQTAIVAERNGAKPEEVAVILDAPPSVPKPIVAATYKRDTRVSSTEHWSAEVFDIRALCRAVADGKASTELVLPNTTALNQLARAMKQTMAIPGVKAVSSRSVSTRTR